MKKIEFTQEQQKLFVLELVKACLDYGKDVQKSFEEVLNEDVFPDAANVEYAEMVCHTLETLNKEGYINGKVELEYEIEIDGDTFEEKTTDAIDFAQCIFEDIGITAKGNAYMSNDSYKKVGNGFLAKAKSAIKYIATTALQTLVETAIVAGVRAVGFPV